VTSPFVIEPATMDHARRIRLRPADAREIAALGYTQEEGLQLSLHRALWADAYLLEGEVAAILGFSLTSLLGGGGQPWFVTGLPIERAKKSFVRECRRRLVELRARYGRLANFVHADYAESLELLRRLGFTIGRPQPFGRLGQPFCLVEMEVS